MLRTIRGTTTEVTPSPAPRARSPCGRSTAASPSHNLPAAAGARRWGGAFRLPPIPVSAFSLTSPSAGFFRTASPARTPSTLAPLIINRLVLASPMPPVKPITSSRAPQLMQRMRVLEHLAADGIEHDVGAAAVGDALDGIAKRLASVAARDDRRPSPCAIASFSSLEAAAITVAPSILPISTAARPTPPPAPCTSSTSPGCKPGRDRSARDRPCRGRRETSRLRHSRRSTAAA